MVSQTISMSPVVANDVVVDTVAAPAASVSAPWYKSLFRVPNLAMAMGALVLVFGGFLGYQVIRDRGAATNSDTVSQLSPQEDVRGGPNASSAPIDNLTANTAANSVPSTTNSNAMSAAGTAFANKPVMTANSAANSSASGEPLGRLGAASTTSSADSTGAGKADDDKAKEIKMQPMAGSPAPPAPASGYRIDGQESRPEPKDEDSKLASRKRAEERYSRDMPAAVSKSGPLRSAGPVQNQTQTNNSIFDMSVSRRVGGRTFNNRNNAWYDASYQGQKTIDVRRGTDEYRKLDGGLRSIADNLGGTVVVVWKSKAYRIQ